MKTLVLLPLVALALACKPAAHVVTYKAIGDPYWPKTDGMGPWTHVVIRNAEGGTEMHDAQTPYAQEITVPAGAFVYLSAQATEGGEITCEIYLDGRLVRRSRSDGNYAIATCSGLA